MEASTSGLGCMEANGTNVKRVSENNSEAFTTTRRMIRGRWQCSPLMSQSSRSPQCNLGTFARRQSYATVSSNLTVDSASTYVPSRCIDDSGQKTQLSLPESILFSGGKDVASRPAKRTYARAYQGRTSLRVVYNNVGRPRAQGCGRILDAACHDQLHFPSPLESSNDLGKSPCKSSSLSYNFLETNITKIQKEEQTLESQQHDHFLKTDLEHCIKKGKDGCPVQKERMQTTEHNFQNDEFSNIYPECYVKISRAVVKSRTETNEQDSQNDNLLCTEPRCYIKEDDSTVNDKCNLKTIDWVNIQPGRCIRKAGNNKTSKGGSTDKKIKHHPKNVDWINILHPGQRIAGCYEFSAIIGQGTFGHVVKVYDHIEKVSVAIKIIKRTEKYFDLAMKEVRILDAMNAVDKEGKECVLKMKRHFLWRSHLCIVFELLGSNLYHILRATEWKGVSLNLVRKFAYDLCTGLIFLSKPELQIIHCDIKPSNIVITLSNKPVIKIVDFGSACQSHHRMFKYIQSRWYRSPEVLLELPYDLAIDMWSLGCVLVELHTGQPLFPGENEVDQLNKIVEVLGMPPNEMLDRSHKSSKFFDRLAGETHGSNVFIPKIDREQKQYLSPGSRYLGGILGVSTGGPNGKRLGQRGHSPIDYLRFKHLILCMLDFNSKKRIKPCEAINHDFFKYYGASNSSSTHGNNTSAPTTSSITSGTIL